MARSLQDILDGFAKASGVNISADEFIDAIEAEGLEISSSTDRKDYYSNEIDKMKNKLKAKKGLGLFRNSKLEKLERQELAKDIAKLNELKKKGELSQDKELKLLRLQNEQVDLQNNLRQKGLQELKSGFSQITRGAKEFLGYWGKIDQKAADFSKSIGTSAIGYERMRKNAIKSITDRNFGINYGVGSEKLIELQQNYATAVGRNIQFSASDQESMAAMNAVMKENGAEFAEKLENFGLSYTDAATRAGKMFKEASKYGLSFEKYSKNVVTNIKLAQNYKFKDGINGLERMAKKATAIKLDMQQIASFADSVNSVEGAISVGSKLQVLGGNFARFADPLGMLNESLTDMEGLQDRFTKMISGMARYNSVKGEIEINSFNQRQIKEAAKAMGMDPNQVLETAMAKGRADYIGRQISGKYDQDTTEFLKNIATVQGGKATVSYIDENGKKQDIDLKNQTVSAEQLKLIKEQNQTEEEDIKSIAKMLRGWDDIMRGTEEQKKAAVANAVETTGIGEKIKNITKDIATMKWLLVALAGMDLFKGVFSGGKGIVNLFKGFFGKGGGNIASTVAGGGGSTAAGAAGRSVLSNIVGKNGLVSKGFNKLGGFVSGKGESLIGKRLMTSSAAKRGLLSGTGKALKFVGGNIAKYGRAASIGGLAGAGINAITNSLVKHGKVKKGGFVDFAGNVGGKAASWGATGAMLGLPGAIIGAALGAGVGAMQGVRNKKAREISEKYGVNIVGDYGFGTGKFKQIEEALKTGEISDKLRHKLEKNGDTELLEKIDSVKQQTVNTENQTTNAQVVNLYAKEFGSGRQTAESGGLLKGPSHKQGGMPILGSNIEVEGGEYVVNKRSAAKNIGLLNTINQMGNGGIIKPKQMSNGGSIPVKPSTIQTAMNLQKQGEFGAAPVGPQDININISGTIKLEGANGQKVDITNDLLNDLNFRRGIINLIETQVGRDVTGGKVINKGLYNL